jgi:hypothetical protein
MKKILFITLLAGFSIIGSTSLSFAQFRGGFSLSAGLTPSAYTTFYNPGGGLQLDFKYLVENHFDIGLSGSAFFYAGKNLGVSGGETHTGVGSIILSGDYLFFPDKGIRPFAGIGLGRYTTMTFFDGNSFSTNHFGISLGGGALFKLGNKTDFNLGLRFHPSNALHRLTLNFGFLFGKRIQD